MTKKHAPSDTEVLEAAAREAAHEKYVLRLYVAGMTPRSQEAIRTVTAICEEHLAGRYELEVIDLYQQPTLAKGEQIIAAPTLIKKLPAPLRRFIGSMANKEKILVGLDLRPKDPREVES
ncbi:MAG: circadian clock KaiB family protein [Planctomycetes bacterium]|nr:circadian clock KaiB family protein [Planctomycetota bacterium]